MGNGRNDYVREALDLARRLVSLADRGEVESLDNDDDSCATLYGVVRDCTHMIRKRAEQERELHERLGVWKRADTERQERRRNGKSRSDQ